MFGPFAETADAVVVHEGSHRLTPAQQCVCLTGHVGLKWFVSVLLTVDFVKVNWRTSLCDLAVFIHFSILFPHVILVPPHIKSLDFSCIFIFTLILQTTAVSQTTTCH